MEPGATTSTYRLGDLLALARYAWVRALSAELSARGHPGFRRSDPAIVRSLLAGPLPVGRLGEGLGITRQGARKVVRQLEARGYATTTRDPDDARRVVVKLTELGTAYGRALRDAIAGLAASVVDRVDPRDLEGADRVLRACLTGELADVAAAIPPPAARGPQPG